MEDSRCRKPTDSRVKQGKTPKLEKGNFLQSLICFCKWGSSEKGSSSSSSKSGDNQEDSRAKAEILGDDSPVPEARMIVSKVPRININGKDSKESQYAADNSDACSGFTSYTELSGAKKVGSKKKKKKSSSQSSVKSESVSSSDANTFTFEEETDTYVSTSDMSDEFSNILAAGLCIHALTGGGSIRSVTITIQDGNLMWGLPQSKPMMSTPLSCIGAVNPGMPLKIAKVFPALSSDRAFYLSLVENERAATFLAPTALERDALIKGFTAVLENNADAGH